MFLLSFPLSLPFDWTLRCWVCVCCFVLFYFGYYVVCCVWKKKKLLMIKKKKKTETKPFTQNANLSHFLEGHLSALHSHLVKESRIFRKPFKIIVSSTLKNMSLNFMAGRVSPHSTASHVFKWKKKNVTLCDWFSMLCIKLCIYMMHFCF